DAEAEQRPAHPPQPPLSQVGLRPPVKRTPQWSCLFPAPLEPLAHQKAWKVVPWLVLGRIAPSSGLLVAVCQQTVQAISLPQGAAVVPAVGLMRGQLRQKAPHLAGHWFPLLLTRQRLAQVSGTAIGESGEGLQGQQERLHLTM